MDTRYIFVTGGVVSSLGKGIISSSLARLLLSRGFRVTIQKFDPYLNIDPGTLNPYEHGECYVTDDGFETDLDLGHYERFTDIITTRANSITTGRIYQAVIDKERKGDYLGKTVQIIPNITDEIKRNIVNLGETGDFDFIITEIGGTVGDIESTPFLEAVRQLKWELDKRALSLHLTYVPYLKAAKELKTKPTQHSVKQLQSIGIQPDILILRSELPIPQHMREKVAQFCNVSSEAVIQSVDASSIYHVPGMMHEQNLDGLVLDITRTDHINEPDHSAWNLFLQKLETAHRTVRIGLVGKYVQLQDAYKSISESLIHAATYCDHKLDLVYINSENVNDDNVEKTLSELDGVVIAPGFGNRGIDGKLSAIKWCRENDVPAFGICLGMQCMVIEYARNVLGMTEANSTEMDPSTPNNVIDMMESQKNITDKGGTMRLGAYSCRLADGSVAQKAYGTGIIRERHRHRYEFNNDYLERVEAAGMKASGRNPDTGLVEIVEIPAHPFFIGVQFHPELKSTPEHPQPIFVAFVKAAMEYSKKKEK